MVLQNGLRPGLASRVGLLMAFSFFVCIAAESFNSNPFPGGGEALNGCWLRVHRELRF